MVLLTCYPWMVWGGTVPSPPTENHRWGNVVKLYFTHIKDDLVCSLSFKFQVKILIRSEIMTIFFFSKKLMVCRGDAYFKPIRNTDVNKYTSYGLVKSLSKEPRNILQSFIVIHRRGPLLQRRKFWCKISSHFSVPLRSISGSIFPRFITSYHRKDLSMLTRAVVPPRSSF